MPTMLNAPATTAVTSADIVVAAGAVVSVGIYSASAADAPTSHSFIIWRKTPGAANFIGVLNGEVEDRQLYGPATYFVTRPELTGAAYGIYSDV